MFDLGYRGQWFTWERGVLEGNNIRERLYRGVANDEWRMSFPNYSLDHLPHSSSYHCTLLVNTNRGGVSRHVMHFKFEVA